MTLSLDNKVVLTKTDFDQEIDGISKGWFFIVNDNGIIKKTDLFSFLWEKIKGAVGKVDKSNTHLLHVSLINFIEYGAKNHFIKAEDLEKIRKIAIYSGLITPKEGASLLNAKSATRVMSGYRLLQLIADQLLNNTDTSSEQAEVVKRYYQIHRDLIPPKRPGLLEMFDKIAFIYENSRGQS